MNVMTLTIESSGVYTQLGVAVDVTGIAQVLHAQVQEGQLSVSGKRMCTSTG